MTDNLPAVHTSTEVAPAVADVDSWTHVVSDVARLSDHIAGTEFVPKGLRDKPAAVAAAILYGREVGLPPMTSLTQTHVIEGKPAISAEGMRALVLAAGHDLLTTETTGAVCTMKARRRGSEHWTTITWTLDMARAAGVAGKQVWKSYPRAMLQARATAELVRLVFPDVIHGFRAVEELDDVDDVPVSGGSDAASSTGSTVQRRTTKKAATKKAAPAPAPTERPAIEGPPLPGEDGYDEPSTPKTSGEVEDAPVMQAPEHRGEAVERPASPDPDAGSSSSSDPASPPDTGGDDSAPEDSPPAAPRAASRPQLRMMHATFGSLGYNDQELGGREARLQVVSDIVNRPVDSTSDLSVDEASAVIDTLARCKTREDVENVQAAYVEHREGR